MPYLTLVENVQRAPSKFNNFTKNTAKVSKHEKQKNQTILAKS